MNMITPDWPAPDNIKACTTTKFSKMLASPTTPVLLHQIHSNIAVEAINENRDTDADASYTSQPDTVCLVFTADCLPILVCNQQGTKVAAIHAGWRGLASGVIESCLKKLNEPADNLMAWLGPAIGPEKFEVGADVLDAFTQHHPEAASAFRRHGQTKWLANLYDLARQRLQLSGISHIYGGNFCTYTQSDLFYSYRREGKHTGRMASAIWIIA